MYRMFAFVLCALVATGTLQLVNRAGQAQTRKDASATSVKSENPRELLAIIKSQQKARVKESFGTDAWQCFTKTDLEEFKRNDVPKQVTDELRHDSHFIDVVLAIKQMKPEARESLLDEGAHTYKPTWAQLGRISREGQTDAGQEAERLIAEAIVGLVRELSKLSRAELDDLP